MFKLREEEKTTRSNVIFLFKEGLEWNVKRLNLELEFNRFILNSSQRFASLFENKKFSDDNNVQFNSSILCSKTESYLKFIKDSLSSHIYNRNWISMPLDKMNEIGWFSFKTQQKQEEFAKMFFEETLKTNFLFFALNAFWHLEKSGYNTTEQKRKLFFDKTEENKEIIKNSVSFVFSLFLEPVVRYIKKFDNKVTELVEKIEKDDGLVNEIILENLLNSWKEENKTWVDKQLNLVFSLSLKHILSNVNVDKNRNKSILTSLWNSIIFIGSREVCYKYLEGDSLLAIRRSSYSILFAKGECSRQLELTIQTNEENKRIMLTLINNDEQLYNNIFPTLTNLIQDLWKQRINAVSISETAKPTTTKPTIKPITEPKTESTTKPTIKPTLNQKNNTTLLVIFTVLAVIIVVLIVVFVLLYLKHKKKTNKKV